MFVLYNFQYGAAVTPYDAEVFETSCEVGVVEMFNYSCFSGENISISCNSTFDGTIIATCSLVVPSSLCNSLGGFNSTLLSIIYNLSDRNEDKCDKYVTQASCGTTVSFLALGDKFCEWNEDALECRFR
jgi:hypothetical protein